MNTVHYPTLPYPTPSIDLFLLLPYPILSNPYSYSYTTLPYPNIPTLPYPRIIRIC